MAEMSELFKDLSFILIKLGEVKAYQVDRKISVYCDDNNKIVLKLDFVHLVDQKEKAG